MEYNYILALDPSGSFNEGKGTTGWCLLDHNKHVEGYGSISAKYFASAEEYWAFILKSIDAEMTAHGRTHCILVVEDYMLYANKAESQINSRMETCRLLGAIQMHCFNNRYNIAFQRALEVKNRWEDPLLMKQIKLSSEAKWKHVNKHERDAMRHALHYFTFKNKLNKPTRKPKHPTIFTNFKEDELNDGISRSSSRPSRTSQKRRDRDS